MIFLSFYPPFSQIWQLSVGNRKYIRRLHAQCSCSYTFKGFDRFHFDFIFHTEVHWLYLSNELTHSIRFLGQLCFYIYFSNKILKSNRCWAITCFNHFVYFLRSQQHSFIHRVIWIFIGIFTVSYVTKWLDLILWYWPVRLLFRAKNQQNRCFWKWNCNYIRYKRV